MTPTGRITAATLLLLTVIDSVKFEDELLQKTYDEYLAVRKELGRTKPICLMDLVTIAVKHLKKHGKLGPPRRESEEINACTVKIDVEVDGVTEPWLLLFKNETHNHPTEIEPWRRGDLHRRRYPRPARTFVCLRRDARHRRGRPAQAH